MDSDPSSNEEHRPVSGVSKQRACDECRTRKIRCDRKYPCSHCRTANLVCRNSVQRPKERKSRVIISKEYEGKIDGIENRLAGIEKLLRSNLAALKVDTKETVSAQNDPTAQNGHPTTSLQSHALSNSTSDRALFPGFTGPNADSILAQEVLERAVGDSPIALKDERLRSALQSLEQMVKMKADATEPSLKPLGGGGSTVTSEFLPPTWHEVSVLLKRAELTSPATFILSFPSTTVQGFVQKCRELYAQPEEAQPTRQLLVYAGLYSLASEFAAWNREHVAEYAGLAKRFQHQVLRTLATFPLIVPASAENIEALMAGACFAIEICKPSLSQTLTSAAARQCQILGYHRFTTMANDTKSDRDKKVMLFWFVYALDKMLSLRLGHASAIQDFEVSLPKPEPSETFSAALVHLMHYWIDVGRIQGQICELLYSPAALTQSNSIRSERAEKLAMELKEVFEVRVKANDAILALFSFGGESTTYMAQQLFSRGDTITHYSTLCLILHAVPFAQPGVSPAVEAARAALQAGPDMSQYQNNYFWTIYCHWITLNTPLTPFTVLFCHILRHYHDCKDDLELLQYFIRSLHHFRSVSEGAEKLYQLCSAFWRVAEAYVHVKNNGIEASQLETGNALRNTGTEIPQQMIGDFDEYLSVLGFAPQPFQLGPNGMPSSEIAGEEDMSTYLQDWYSGNASLYGLLEQDLSNITGFGLEDYPAPGTWSEGFQ